MSIDRQMGKEDVVHIYNGILLSHKQELNWVICRDVDLGTMILSEISHTEKDTYHKISLIEGM